MRTKICKIVFSDINKSEFEDELNQMIDDGEKLGMEVADIKYAMIRTDDMTSFAHSALIIFNK